MESIFTTDTWQSIYTHKKKIIFNAGAETMMEYFDPKSNFVPEIQLLFSPFGLPFVPIEIVGSNTNKIISALSWTKDRNNPGGTLSVTFVPDAAVVKEIVDIINMITGNLYSVIWGELGVEIEDLFKPMTLMQLWINGYHVMTGTVRSCHRNVSVSNTSKEVSYTLVCDELGNLYNLGTLSLDQNLKDQLQSNLADSLKTAMTLVGSLKCVTMATGIGAVIGAFKLTTLKQGISNSDGLPLALRMLATGNPIGGIADLSLANSMIVNANLFQMNSAGGGVNSVWSFLKNFVPSPWMEFFTESGGRTIVTDAVAPVSVLFPGFNYIVARTVPYSNPLLGMVNPKFYTSLIAYDLSVTSMLIGGDFVVITDDMIHNKNLGVDCTNQKTIFCTNYSAKGASQTSNQYSRSIKSPGPFNPFASGGIPTFGAREMVQNVDALSQSGLNVASSIADRIAKDMLGLPTTVISKPAFSNLLAVWFRNQSRFKEGSVTIRGMAYARAGMYCLYLPEASGKKKVENLRDIGIYYIDSLDHEYTLTNDKVEFTTTLHLIRGVPLPISLAQNALLLFDYEVLPPESGLSDGEYSKLVAMIQAVRSGPHI